MKDWFLNAELRACLTDFIRDSTTPFWWLAVGAFHSHLKLQLNSCAKVPFMLSKIQLCYILIKYSWAPTKFEPRSDQHVLGWPLRLAKRLKDIRKVLALLPVTSSRCTALIVMQVKMMTWASLSVLRLSLTCTVPNMSIAVSVNTGQPSVGRRPRICPISCSSVFFLSFLQVTHISCKKLC